MASKVEPNSSTSSSNTPFAQLGTFIRWLWGCRVVLVATFVALLVLGELYMRVVFLPSVVFQTDPEIGYTYRPNQRTIAWQGNYSVPSPPLSFNSDGNRGPKTNWEKKIILALGSSEVVGPGIKDDQTWTAQLERLVHERDDDEAIEVVNGGISGHGPFHHAISLDRVLEKHQVETVILRVSVADRNFGPPDKIAEKSALRRFLRDQTMFIRFLVNKSQAQVRAIRQATVPFPLRSDRTKADSQFVEAAKRMWSDHEKYWVRTIESTSRHDARLVFVVINAADLAGDSYLANQLKQISQGKEHVSVIELGPSDFDLDDVPDEERAAVFKKDWTLIYDPHANAKHHRVTAEALYQLLSELPQK